MPLSRLFYCAAIVALATVVVFRPYLIKTQPRYEAPLETMGDGVVPNRYMVELQLGSTLVEHEAWIGRGLAPFVVEVRDPFWYGDWEGEIHRRGIRYDCMDVDDDLSALIRSDPSVRVVFIQSRHV
jgi:hypothetical protein